jgi:hypothetical protein
MCRVQPEEVRIHMSTSQINKTDLIELKSNVTFLSPLTTSAKALLNVIQTLYEAFVHRINGLSLPDTLHLICQERQAVCQRICAVLYSVGALLGIALAIGCSCCTQDKLHLGSHKGYRRVIRLIPVEGLSEEESGLKSPEKNILNMPSDARNRTTPSGSSSPSSVSTSSTSSPLHRLQNIVHQMMASPIATTSFPAEAVPQAPEDPLFGLMRAYRADESKDKVDLVGSISVSWTDSKLDLLTTRDTRASEHTATTMQSPGFYQWSRRYAVFCALSL